MDPQGYLRRLFDHFHKKPQLYRQLSDITPGDIAVVRQGLAAACLPKRYWRKAWGESTTPFAYLTYKGKCFGETGAWTCTSSHCHMREIVSYSCCPSSPYLSKIARCIRAIHKACVSDEKQSFVLWNQSAVSEALRRKIKHLQPHKQHPGKCPCGKHFDRLQIIKTDATAFFTLVNRTRCLEEVRTSIKQLEDKHATGIILHRELRNVSKVLYRGKRPPRTHQFISFTDIGNVLDYLAFDKFLLVGNTVFERLDGLAMGNATSPPLTSFDLDHHSRKVYTDKNLARQVGAYIAGMPTTRVLQSLLHVDDCITTSKILCEDCLTKTVKALWPPDVEAKVEETGPEVDFLHCHIQTEANSIHTNNVHVTPLAPNARFCRGETTTPKVAKCQQYIHGVHKRNDLCPVIWGKFAIITNTCRHNYNDAKHAIICNIVECILLGWSPRDVGISAANYPKSHKNTTANCIRMLGQTIKKSHTVGNAWRRLHRPGANWLAHPWYREIEMCWDHVATKLQQ